MLASGAHVKIGDKEFRLDFGAEGAYTYSLNSTGEEIQFWLWDDWSGGEGNDAYDPLDEIVYHQGNVNPRIPGKLTTPPTRTTISTGALASTPDRALTVISNNRLWLVGELVSSGSTKYWHTADLTSFASISDSGWNTSVDRVTAVASDGSFVYVVGHDDSTGDYQIRKFNSSASPSNVRQFGDSNVYPIIGAAILGNYIYTWNGNNLRRRNLDTSPSDTGSSYDIVVDTLGNDLSNMTYRQDYWGDLINGEDSLYYFFATEGRTVVLERQPNGATTEIWNLPNGFTGKSMTYQSGALILVGEYLNHSCAWGMSTINRQPIFLGFIRLGTDISTDVVGSGFGTEVLLAESDASSTGGRIFVYDIGFDAFSQLDQISHTGGEVWSVGTFKDKRFVALKDTDSLDLYLWSTDDDPSKTVDGRMESGVWDFDLPEDEKQLDGIHVLSDAGSGTPAANYEVFYMVNESGTWVSAGTRSSGFHNYHPVSTGTSTVTFRTLRLRIDPKAACQIYALSARVRVTTYEEVWELLLDLTDESVDDRRSRRRRTHEDRGWQLRDYIRSIANSKQVVTFLDGARYPQGDRDDPNKYSTHTVVVDIPLDQVDQLGEGRMIVRLRSVETN